MNFYTIEATVIIALLVLGAIWIAATWKEPFWNWYYDGVLGGVPPPGDRGAPGAVHVSASSRVSNSAPSSSAATVHVNSASGHGQVPYGADLPEGVPQGVEPHVAEGVARSEAAARRERVPALSAPFLPCVKRKPHVN